VLSLLDEILKNPVRLRILEILCSRKVATPKEIAKELNMRVPAVYYHLDLMRGLVTKTSRGEYSATEKGVALYKNMIKEEVRSKTSVGQIAPNLDFINRLTSLKVLLPGGAAAIALELIVCTLLNYRPYFFGYAAHAANDPIPVYAYYAGNFVLLFLIVECFAYVLTRRVGGEIYLAGGIGLARLPLLLILLPKILGITFWLSSAVTFATGPLLSIVALAIFASISKGIRIELAFIMSFVLLYFDLFIYTLI
jgi:DNA-binding transcriptional ArsR family regulator